MSFHLVISTHLVIFLSKLVGYLRKTVSHRQCGKPCHTDSAENRVTQTVRKTVSHRQCVNLASTEPSSDCIAYKNTIWTLPGMIENLYG